MGATGTLRVTVGAEPGQLRLERAWAAPWEHDHEPEKVTVDRERKPGPG